MKIYIAHSRSFDFLKELYQPIKYNALSKGHIFIFPHEEGAGYFSSKELFQKGCNLVIAEVSYPSIRVGLELGWADMLNIPIVCIYKNGSKFSDSLSTVAKQLLEYGDSEQLIDKIKQAIQAI